MFKKIERKDLLYWLGFSIVLWLLSSEYGKGNQALLDNWTFAGTVVSIILAVIAIIITVDQGSTAVDSTKKLENASEKIEAVSTKLEKISVDELFLNLEGKIETINTTLDERMEIKFSVIEELINKSKLKSEISLNDLLTKDEWKKKISFTEGLPNLALLYAFLSTKNSNEIDLRKLANYLLITSKTDVKSDLRSPIVISFSYIYLTFEFMGLIGFERDSYKVKINNISLELSEAIDERIQEARKEGSSTVEDAVKFFEKMNAL
ncbi:hypothetical protein [Peribacillus simplex]|uniref:hypothetical protein n=1 Tax=Peribacillus simplex TaxID=1478 RepID=UPI003D264F03